MKQAKLLLLFVVAFAMLFAGCANSPAPGSDPSQLPSPDVSKKDDSPEHPGSTTSEAEKALVSVDYATDELLGKYDSFAEFIEFEDEDYQKIIFTTNIAVKDFRFIEIGFEAEDTDVTFFENNVLYSLAELLPTKPFVVTWMEWGSIPHRGISFIDETDTTRYFYIAMSGEDGSLLLVEFENE